MRFKDLVRAARSHRRFVQDDPVSGETLLDLADMARTTSSAANLQPLKFVLSNEPELNERIFSTLGWAGYLAHWPGPEPGERPAAYAVILQDEAVALDVDCDHGLAAWTILLGAAEQGVAGCILGSIQREKLAEALELPQGLRILLVVALGRPAETVVLETAHEGNIRYYRDDDGVHHTPKRPLEEVVVATHFKETAEKHENNPGPGAVDSKTAAVNSREKARIIAGWLDEAKALDLTALDVEGICPIAEAMVIATATSPRHAKGAADRVTDRLGEQGLEFLGMEGYRAGDWILLDCNDVVVHIFQEETRRLYDLEGLWSEAEIIDVNADA
jgi:ribosome silencing factor RsfS/YbeB/iojap